MKGANYCDDGFIAGLHNFWNLCIALANLKKTQIFEFKKTREIKQSVLHEAVIGEGAGHCKS